MSFIAELKRYKLIGIVRRHPLDSPLENSP